MVRFASILTVAALLVAFPAAASSMRHVPFDEKVEQASAIVLARCIHAESRFDEQHRWILTYTTFKVARVFSGSAVLSDLTVVLPDGTVDGIHQATIGVPTFRLGEDYVLFIRNSRVGPTILNFEQGVYPVRTDAAGVQVVVPYPSEVVHVDTQRGVAVPAEQERSLQQFAGEITQSKERAAVTRLQAIRERRQPESVWEKVWRNKGLVSIILVAVAFAVWMFVRR